MVGMEPIPLRRRSIRRPGPRHHFRPVKTERAANAEAGHGMGSDPPLDRALRHAEQRGDLGKGENFRFVVRRHLLSIGMSADDNNLHVATRDVNNLSREEVVAAVIQATSEDRIPVHAKALGLTEEGLRKYIRGESTRPQRKTLALMRELLRDLRAQPAPDLDGFRAGLAHAARRLRALADELDATAGGEPVAGSSAARAAAAGLGRGRSKADAG